VLVAAVGAGAVGIYVEALRGFAADVDDVRLQWWLLAALFFVAEAYPVHLHFRSEAHSVTLTELGLVLGLFLAPPGQLLLGQAVGIALALVAIRRQRPLKVAFNLAEYAFAAVLAVLAFHAVTGHAVEDGPVGWGAALGAVAVYSATGALLVSAAIALTERAKPLRQMAGDAGFAISGSLACACVALVAVELLDVEPAAIALLVVPAGVCLLAFRAYGAERRRHEHVNFLYSSMRAMQSAPELRLALRELLTAARTLLSAELAEIVLFDAGAAGGVLRSVIGPLSEELAESDELTAEEQLVVESGLADEHAVLLPRGRAPHVLDAYLARHGLDDAILTVLHGTERTCGLLLVGNRAGDVSTFTADDRAVFETFARHAAVLLENDRVKEELRYQAYHDALTGLPNRVLFAERVSEELGRRPDEGEPPTVLFLDLDDFKTINDSLGHTAGDDLLVAVAGRVRNAVRNGDIAARLGGDEFGVLLSSPRAGEAEAVAERLIRALRAPFTLHGRELLIHASIGIATSTAGDRLADDLLANADIAMYSAKSSGKRQYAFYEPRMHTRVRRRHELASSLEQAVDRDEIKVYYQPIVSLANGRTVGVEALARWLHPSRGLVLPGSFVPLAEEIGLMSPIGRRVLHEACRQTREWQATLPGRSQLTISVNLSPLELQNPGLIGEVSDTLERTGLAPQSLVLEITESGAMRDHAATLATMRELRRLGVRLALDDFGTGHSSLSHLREFPIDILKIAKSFVDRLGGESSETTLVDAILRLAGALELSVVAEGIERSEQWEVLRLLDCPLGQGYLFARPFDGPTAERSLRLPALPEQASSRVIRAA
jgi:diguanylate cyclase (GGDEF)-like protein